MKFEETLLWESVVGSHMWGMQHAGSDVDLFTVYALDTDAILLGKNPKGKQKHTETIDVTKYEIGHVVRELQKGNINFLWGVTSPITKKFGLFGDKYLVKLSDIVRNNLTKNYYHAVKGLSLNHLKKYFKIKYDDGIIIQPDKYPIPVLGEKWQKKCKLINRTLCFGIFLLNGNISYEMTGHNRNPTLTQVVNNFYKLEKEYLSSNLPEKPDKEIYEEFLINLRTELWYMKKKDRWGR